MTTERIRVFIPVDLEISSEHLSQVFSREWQEAFYSFTSKEEFALYAIRLMTVAGSYKYNEPLDTVKLQEFDGHCTDDAEANGILTLAPEDDEAWSIESIQDFVESLRVIHD